MTAQTLPKSDGVHRILEERILSGLWPVGHGLPKETELAQEFDCGRHTIAQAVSRLIHDGLVERRKRAGTRVIGNVKLSEKPPVELDAFAFIYPSDQHEGLWRTVHGFQSAASEKRRPVVTLSAGINYEKEAEFVKRLSEFDVRGAVLHPVIRSTTDQAKFCQLLLSAKFPIVLAGASLPGVDCPVVITDGFDAGYTMTKYLLSQGLRRVGFFADHARTLTMRDRYQGYRWALKEAGVEERSELLYLEASMQPNYQNPFDEPARMATKYLAQAKGLEGVVCAHDFLAIGLIQAARDLGVRVPEDLKVVGIDGHSIAGHDNVSLTTYQVPAELTGRKAFELLEDLVEGRNPSSREVQIKGEIMVRSSSRPS